MATRSSATRTSISALLDDARRELMTSIQGLTEEQLEAPLPDGWSVKDILAHVAMWEEIALLDVRRAARGDKTALGAWDHSFNDQWNNIHFALRKSFPLGQVLTELSEARQGMMEVLGSVEEQRLAGGFIPDTCAIHAKHDREHAKQIRDWRQQKGV
jgi:hypothetical protein